MVSTTLSFFKMKHPFQVIIGLCAVSILVTFASWFVLPPQHLTEASDDWAEYAPVARNLLKGRGFVTDRGSFAAIAPGYPLLLAGIFGLSRLLEVPENYALSALILACGSLSSVFLYLAARSAWGLKAALVPSLLWITYPLLLASERLPANEQPFMVVFYAGFYFFWLVLLGNTKGWSICFIAGLLIGLAMLIRPIAIGLGFVMATAFLVAAQQTAIRLRVFLATMLLLGVLVAVLSWQIFVYAKSNQVIPISAHGPASMVDGLTFAVTGGYRPIGGFSEDVMSLMRDILARQRQHEMQSVSEIISVMWGEFQRRPLAAIKLLAIKAMRSWYATDSRRFETEIILIQIPYLLLISWSTLAAWKLGGAPRQLCISIWLIVLYFWGMTMLVMPIVRYMMPVMGLLFLLIPASFTRAQSVTA
jgi:4-amino-4-deoxy-L-arabinose transferase-like glycosyltransferase